MKRHTAGRVALATALLLCATTSLWAGQAARFISTAALEASSQYLWDSPPVGSDDLDPINWRSSDPVHFSGIRALPVGDGVLGFQAIGYDAKAMLMNAQREAAGPSLMKMYRDALMQETRRSMRRDPSLFWHESVNGVDADIHEGFTMHRARRSAEKIFGEAHQELLADALNHLIETTEPLNALNQRIRGVDFHVRAAGSQSSMVPFDIDAPSRGARRPSTKVSFVVSNKPRLTMERMLPGGIKASVEVPLASPGLRTTFSKHIAGTMRGTLSFGVEDMGEELWVSAGLRCGF